MQRKLMLSSQVIGDANHFVLGEDVIGQVLLVVFHFLRIPLWASVLVNSVASSNQ